MCCLPHHSLLPQRDTVIRKEMVLELSLCKALLGAKPYYPLILKRTAAASAWAVVGDGEGDTVLLGEVEVLTSAGGFLVFLTVVASIVFFVSLWLSSFRILSFSSLRTIFWLWLLHWAGVREPTCLLIALQSPRPNDAIASSNSRDSSSVHLPDVGRTLFLFPPE